MSACHWCHVMEHESFADPDIAAVMNEHFVNIKVDREERPDLDQIYQSICQLVTRSGGWPLSVFLTPDQRPFYVGTYFPPDQRYGRPGFKQLLHSVAKAYREKRSEVASVADTWTGAIADLDATPAPEGEVPGRPAIKEAAQALSDRIDMENGGFGGAPKFPNTFSLELMLRHGHHSGDPMPVKLVSFTLRQMAEGGIYDQLGGGFHRYSVDARWAVPHFEKMLYDNAALPPLYLAAWQATGETLFRRIVEETLDYVMREMTHPEGGFYSTTDADSEGEEGKFFAFNREEVFEAVGPGLGPLMCRYYGVTEEGNFEHTGKTVLYIAEQPDAIARELHIPLPELEARLDQGRRLMLAYREKRVPPFRDEKILTAWNGLMISAFARAGRALRSFEYTSAARAAAEFVLTNLTDGEGGLLRRYKDGKAGIPGYIEDYSYFAAGLLDLYEATFDERYLELAERYTRDSIRLFYDNAGGFFLTQAGGEQLIHRPKDATDSSTPAGSSITVINLLRLLPFTGDDSFRQIAETVFRAHRKHMEKLAGGMGTLLQALDMYLSGAVEVTIVGPAPEEWLANLGRRFEPNLVLSRIDAPKDGAAPPIWSGKTMKDGKPSLYVCRNFACSPPATDWREAEQYLS